MATVLIGGGSGLMGSRLSQFLQERGHEVRHFSRSAKPGSEYPTYTWNVQTGTYDEAAFEEVTHVINLAGAGIADAPWTASRKKLIISSRTDSTRLLQ
ncbi:MAG: NAD-dependent epimerase/dehydratase family protein, partial [Bacteroidota bacterium]